MQQPYIRHYRRLAITAIILLPAILLFVLIGVRVIPIPVAGNAIIFSEPSNYYRQPLQLSHDAYTNADSQHDTELEPGTFSYGSTIVTAFQVGRFADGGSSNTGWATSTDGGLNWRTGFLPGTTQFTGGPYTRVSDPVVAYDR